MRATFNRRFRATQSLKTIWKTSGASQKPDLASQCGGSKGKSWNSSLSPQFLHIMDHTRRAELIELAAICQFKADHPGGDWNGVQASSAAMDKRAQYLFYAEELSDHSPRHRPVVN